LLNPLTIPEFVMYDDRFSFEKYDISEMFDSSIDITLRTRVGLNWRLIDI